MFEKHKLEKAANERRAALATWENEDNLLLGMLHLLAKGGGPDGGGPAEIPLVLKKGEQCSTGVRYRIGQSRGTFVQGDESQTVIDTGTIVLTTQRAVFMGATRTVEWAFSKLIGIQHYEDRPWTAIQVSNRQKVSGITYDDVNEHNLRMRLEVALALFNDDTAALQAQLDQAIAAHDADRPPEPSPAVAAPV